MRVQAKKHTLQLLLPAEVLADSSKAERSATTGHLLLRCTKVHPVVVSKAPQKAKPEPKPESLAGPAVPALAGPGENLKGSVDVRGIVSRAPETDAGAKPKQEDSLGADFSDEEDVPDLL